MTRNESVLARTQTSVVTLPECAPYHHHSTRDSQSRKFRQPRPAMKHHTFASSSHATTSRSRHPRAHIVVPVHGRIGEPCSKYFRQIVPIAPALGRNAHQRRSHRPRRRPTGCPPCFRALWCTAATSPQASRARSVPAAPTARPPCCIRQTHIRRTALARCQVCVRQRQVSQPLHIQPGSCCPLPPPASPSPTALG